MVGYLYGRVINKKQLSKHISKVLVRVSNGNNAAVGYEIMVGTRTAEGIMPDTLAELWIYHHITDKSQELYGLSSPEEKEVAERLLTVTGVGPKAAITAVNHYSVSELGAFIMQKDTKALQKIPGLGAKTAANIIVQLSSDRDLQGLFVPTSMSGSQAAESPDNKTISVVKASMVRLGFTNDTIVSLLQQKQDEIQQALGKKQPVEDIIKILLRQ